MEIHKPKPWHGWREFLKEYGIIVLGVLTALAAEQAVEWLHWQHVLQEERAALNDNARGLYRAMHARVDMQPCIDARLADIATILRRHDLGRPLGIKGPIGRPSYSGVSLSAFDMAMADQAFSHMPMAEKRGYFSMKGAFALFSLDREIEIEAWRTLRTLDRAETFTPADWADVAKANDRAIDVNQVFKTDLKAERSGQWLYPYRAFPQPARSSLLQIPWVVELCRASVL